MTVLWRFHLFGALRLEGPGGQVVTRPRYEALVVYLAYHHPSLRPREELAEIRCPDACEGTGALPPDEIAPGVKRNRLRVALSALRRQFEPPGVPWGAVLIADRKSVGFSPETTTSDVADFRSFQRAARRAATERERAYWLARTVGLYRGDLLPGHYDDWVIQERRHFETECISAQRQLAAVLKRLGEPDLAEQYIRCADAMDKGTGEPPFADAQDLADALAPHLPTGPRAQIPTPLPSHTRSPVAGASVVLSAGSASAVAPYPHETRLPVYLTRFFGRGDESARLKALLCDPATRLVTLTGPGGAGKTRLAVEVAQSIALEGVTVWFVALVDVSDVCRILEAVAGALRLERFPDADVLEQVAAHLNRAASLLVLDNFEHLTAGGAEVVKTLLARVPGLTCLATSRTVLSLDGETEFPVSLLPVPASDVPPKDLGTIGWLMTFPSIQLFRDRALRAKPDFQLTAGNAPAVTQICQRLEGIPLALEIAASKINQRTPVQMLGELERRFAFLRSHRRAACDRHRSLWAAMDWSFQLLRPELQRFFARLFVFRGGCTPPAAQVVCEETRAGAFLEELAAQSLAVAQPTSTGARFYLLETVRAFAQEQLDKGVWDVLVQRHAEYYFGFAEQIEPHLTGPKQAAARRQVESEHGNLRAALAQWRAGGNDLWRAGALWRSWLAWDYAGEQRRWMEELLPRDDVASPALAERLLMAGNLAGSIGQYADAQALHHRSLQVWRVLNNKRGIADSLSALGQAAFHQGDLAAARPLLEQSLAFQREVGNNAGTACMLNYVGNIERIQGNHVTARALHEESLGLFRQLADVGGTAGALYNLGLVATDQGDLAGAFALHAESLALFRDLRDRGALVFVLEGLAAVAVKQKRWTRAARLLGSATCLRDAVCCPLPPVGQDRYKRDVSAARNALGAERFALAWEEGCALPWEEAVGYALKGRREPTAA